MSFAGVVSVSRCSPTSFYPCAIRLLAGREIGGFGIRVIRSETRVGQEDIGLPPMMLGEHEFPLGVGRAGLARRGTVSVEDWDSAQGRGVRIGGKGSTPFTDQQHHRLTPLNVIRQSLDERRRPLAEMLLVAHLEPLAPKHAGDFTAVMSQLVADGGNEYAVGDHEY